MKVNAKKKWKRGIVVLLVSAMLASNALTIFADEGTETKTLSVETKEMGGGR